MEKERRKQLQEAYKQMKTYMGVFQITNHANDKIYIGSSPNLKNRWLTLKAQLDMGRFANAQLQKEWKELGVESFTYEVLEQKETDGVLDVRWGAKQMAMPWLEKLQPFDDRGYNKPEK